jgi:hypothetical protein
MKTNAARLCGRNRHRKYSTRLVAAEDGKQKPGLEAPALWGVTVRGF